jgi:pimeloyl-ACP methyl ester carboxylesterase
MLGAMAPDRSDRFGPSDPSDLAAMPALDGVAHRFVDVGNGVRIHVADAGPADGPAVMFVHGFPQHWWEWHELIGPLAADGFRVLCPDLRGAGWSSAPRGGYLKKDMADDLADVLDRLEVGPVRLVGHDWGGPIAFIMMLRHPEKAAGFFGVNTFTPFLPADGQMLRSLWRYWYQLPIAAPLLGPLVIADPKFRFARPVIKWVGGGYLPGSEDFALYLARMRVRGHAGAGSRWYRTFLAREVIPWMRGEFDRDFGQARVEVPVRWLHATGDPVITPMLLRLNAQRFPDYGIEFVGDLGHWIIDQRPELVLDRVRAFLRGT